MYRARQLALDRRVAVKVLKSDHEFPAHERRQFGREARAVARLNHPHIASIYDFGAEENGRLLWLAMEFVEGESLRSIQRADPGIVRLLDLFEQLLGGLAAAHARGIIHRDLKPEHVPITQDDAGEESVKLVDFGLVEVQKGTLDLDGAPGGLGDEESEANYRLRATPRYAAPEVVSRGEAEPESDLYAVGVMLYEFLSDEPPFSGDGTGEIVRKHLEEPVPDLQPREDLDVPASLERCVDRLLSKDPSERFSSAAKLRDEIADLHRRIRRRRSSSSRGIFESKSDAITSLGQTPGDTNPPAQMFEGASEPRSAASPRVGPLVDRETERDLLERRIRKTVEQEEGQFALITGEPGIGKSRLVEWLRVRIEEAGWMQIGQGDYTPSGGSLDGVIAAVTDVTGLRKLPPHRTVEGARTLFDEFDLDERQVDRLCRLIGPRPEGGDRLEAARVSSGRVPGGAPEAIFGTIEELLRSLAEELPVLLILEELHLASRPTGKFLEHLVTSLELDPAPIFVLGAGRRSGFDAESDVGASVRNVVHTHPDCADRVNLDPLGAEAIVELLNDRLPLTDGLAERIADRSAGRPEHAIQLLRYLRETDRLENHDERWELEGDTELADLIPDETIELEFERLRRLGSAYGNRRAVRSILTRAAVLGERFEYALLHEMLQREPGETWEHELDEVLERGVRRGVLRQVAGSGEDILAFDHELMRDALLAEMPDGATYRILHRAAGRAKEAYWDQLDVSQALDIAGHFRCAGDDADCCRHLVRAAERSARMSNLRRARKLYLAAVDLAPGDTLDDPASPARTDFFREGRGMDVSLQLAHLNRILNNFDEARAGYEYLLDSDDALRRAAARVGLGRLAERDIEFEEAEDHYGRAVTLLENVRTHGETARMTELEALLGVGRLQRLKGELRRAGHLLARAAKRASERDFVDIQADAVESLAEIFWHRAEFDRSTRFLERLRELANRFQRYDLYTAALLFEARSRVDVGDWDDAERALDEALEAIERLDDPRELAQCLTIRGYLQCCRDELNSATSKLQRAEYLFDAVDDPRGALRATFRIAQLELARGQLERAERRHREGREEFESFDAYFEAARCRQLGGRIAYRRGDLERARRRLSAAVREFEEMGARWECMRAALGLALVCDECGDRAEADQWLDRVLGTDFCSQLGDRFVQEERQELVSRLAERSSPPVEALRPSS